MPSVFEREVFEHNNPNQEVHKRLMAEYKEKRGDVQIENVQYAKLMQDWLRCSTIFVDDLQFAPVMRQQLERVDLDTVCAFELY